MQEFNTHINSALLLLERALDEIETGFVACERCGDQEDTKNLDFVDDLKTAREELLKTIQTKEKSMTTLNPCPACDSELPTRESSRETQQSRIYCTDCDFELSAEVNEDLLTEMWNLITPQDCINNRGLTPLEPARSISGYWIHPAIQASYNETTTIDKLVEKLSEGKLTTKITLFEDDATPPHWNQYVDGNPAESFAAIHNWHPKSDQPDGFLVALYDDEDVGPAAVFAVPASTFAVPEEHTEKEDTQ